MNVQDLKCTVFLRIFGFNACRYNNQIAPYYLKLYFYVGVFL